MKNTQQNDDLVHGKENGDFKKKTDVKLSAKKVLIGAGARVLFYPTLFYNVIRYNIDSDFRWWDPIDQVKNLCLISMSRFSAVINFRVSFLFLDYKEIC